MIKKTIDFIDFEKNPGTADLWFNLTKEDFTGHMILMEEWKDLAELIQGAERDLTSEEVQQILDLIKQLVRLSYGVRYTRQDGRIGFRKTEADLNDFLWGPEYSAFIMSLFENPEEGVNFIVEVMPDELQDELNKEVAKAEKALEKKKSSSK